MNLEQHVIGDTLDQNISIPDYPASDGWTLKYRFTPRDSGGSAIDITASSNATARPTTCKPLRQRRRRGQPGFIRGRAGSRSPAPGKRWTCAGSSS